MKRIQQYLERLCNGRRKSRRRGASALALQPHRTIGMEPLESRAMLAVVLPNLPAGSQYQLAFVTASSRTAESASIDFYNAFANAQASQSSELPAATWSAVVSTPTVDALSNAITYPAIPIYNTRGELIASGAAVWWSTQHSAAIAYDQWGIKNSTNFEWVWTGSNPDGSRANALGSSQFTRSTVGVSYGLDVRWAVDNTQPNQYALPVYALSSVVTAAGTNDTPSAVTGLSCVAGNAQVVLNWTAPSSNGGRVITDYLVQVSSNGGTSWTTFSDGTSTASTATVTGLTNGTAYIFRVAAVNAFGAGAYSAASAAVIPATTPSAPTLLAATSGVGKVTLSWTAPVSNGGSGVTDYRVEYSSNEGTSWTPFSRNPSTELTATVTGLSNYVAYVFRVRATNSAGSGTYSLPSDSVEPASPEADFDTAIVNGAVAITNYKGPGGDVVIPQRINGAKVEALASGLSFPTSVNSVTIPKSVSVIEFSAGQMFANVSAIVVDSGHATYTTIDGILYNKDVTSLIQCPGRKSGRVFIPSSVKNLGTWGFAYCASMTDVVIPQGVAGIGWGTFYGCSQLASVSIPTSVGRIDTLAFARCKSLAAVSLPAGVTFIGGQAFEGCTSLAGVVIPDAVLTIGASAFSGCVSLVSVSLPRGITAIAQATFSNCTSLPAITIPDSVISLGSSAFSNCSALTVVICEGNAPAVMGTPFGGVPSGTVFYFTGRTGWGPTLGGLPTKLAADAAQTKALTFVDETTIKSDWTLQGNWRVEGNGLRLLDINASLTSKQAYDSTLQKIVFSYDVTPNTQMWLSIWGETLSFEVPSSSVGSVVATIQRQGDTITFESGTGTSTVVQIKQANLATATPIVLRMDQRNLYRPTMQLLLKSAEATTNAIVQTYKPTNLRLSSLAVGEAQPAGTTVGVLATTSVVTSDYTYTLIPGDGAQDNASFTIVGNQLRTSGVFSVATKPSYSVRIRTTDRTQQTFEKAFTITVLGAGVAQNQSYSLTDESAIKSDWTLQGNWRVEGNGLRLLDINASLTSRQAYDSTLQRIVFSYDITPNTQMWLSIWGETLSFEVPSSAVGSVVATIQRQGDTITFDSGTGTSTVVQIKQANLATATPIVLRMDQRNLYRPTMQLLLKSAQVTTLPAPSLSVPSAPTGVGGTSGDGQASISWTAPSSNGNAGVTDYLIQFSSNSGSTWTTFSDGISTATSATITGLTNGATYIFRVAAVNAVGAGAYSPASLAVTPATTPSAPTGVSATSGNGQASVSWLAPTSNGGNAITDYVVQFSSNGGTTWTTVNDGASTVTAAIITSLTNGTAYVFRIAAANAVGIGAYSIASSAVTPATNPAAPTNVIATAGDGQTSISWTAPISNGGSAITDYLVQFRSTSGTTWTTFNDGISTGTAATVIGLTNGTAYVFRIAAANAVGTGAYSTASVAVTPATTPSAPTGVIATASNGQVRLSWTPPSSNGGTAVTDYVISFATNRFPFPMTTVIDGTSTATSATITGLTNGTTYVFWVAAVNAVGTGSYSTASSAVTPATTPSAPTGVVVTAGNGQADVFWTFPTSNGGSFITDYVIQYSSNGGSTWRTFSDGTSNLERATITGLTNGTAYMFRVAAVNAAGASAYSLPPGEAVVYVAPGEVMVETGTYLGPQGRRKQGAGTLIVTGSHMNSGATVVEEGQIVVRDTMALGLGALDIKAGAKVVFETGTDLIRLAALTIDSGGLLDVGTTGFVLPDDVATAASVRQLLVAGMTSNAFGVKSGITSHFAGTGHYRVGYSNDSGDLVTRLAIAGDTNLDGRQDVLDVSSMMAAGLYDTGVPASWGEGDFNFDGVFDILDMTSFLGSGRFDTGNYRGTWQVAMSRESQLAPDAVIVALAVTVEPQSRVGKRGRMLF